MLRKVRDLEGLAVAASDGNIGEIEDFLIDDHSWHVRYFVVELSSWLSRRDVLLAPEAFGTIDWAESDWQADLTREAIAQSPELSTHTPITRYEEDGYRGYFGWPGYRPTDPVVSPGASTYPDGGTVSLGAPGDEGTEAAAADELASPIDPHLFSVNDLCDYTLNGRDREAGVVRDLVVDETTFEVRYVVCDVERCVPGKVVLVPVSLVEALDWDDCTVRIAASQQSICKAPAFAGGDTISAKFEERVKTHFA